MSKKSQSQKVSEEEIINHGKIYRCDSYVLGITNKNISFAEGWELEVSNHQDGVWTQACFTEQRPLYWWSNKFKKIGDRFVITTNCDHTIEFVESDPKNEDKPTLFIKDNRTTISQKVSNAPVVRATCFPVKVCERDSAGTAYLNRLNMRSLCHSR